MSEPLKRVYFGIPLETSLPFSEIKNRQNKPEVTGGILKNLANAVSKELGFEPVLVLLPKKRIAPELLSGQLSVVCYASETWYPNTKGLFDWSIPFATNTNVIVGINNRRVKKVEDLYGKNVGAIVNFIYQYLDPYFEKKLISRDNGPTNESNIRKLLHGRVDYILLTNMEYDYYKKTYPQLQADDLKIDRTLVKCLVSKKSKIDVDQLNRALEKFKNTGEIQRIFTP